MESRNESTVHVNVDANATDGDVPSSSSKASPAGDVGASGGIELTAVIVTSESRVGPAADKGETMPAVIAPSVKMPMEISKGRLLKPPSEIVLLVDTGNGADESATGSDGAGALQGTGPRSMFKNNIGTEQSVKIKKKKERHLLSVSPDRESQLKKLHKNLKFDNPSKIAMLGAATAIMTYDEMGLISSFNAEAVHLFHFADGEDIIGQHVTSLLSEVYKEEAGDDRIRDYFGLCNPEVYAIQTNEMFGGELTALQVLCKVNEDLGSEGNSPASSEEPSSVRSVATPLMLSRLHPSSSPPPPPPAPPRYMQSQVQAITTSGDVFTMKLVVRKILEPSGMRDETPSPDGKEAEHFSFVATLYNLDDQDAPEFEQWQQMSSFIDDSYGDTYDFSRATPSMDQKFMHFGGNSHGGFNEKGSAVLGSMDGGGGDGVGGEDIYSIELRPSNPPKALFIEMEELDLSSEPFDEEKSEWREVARWNHGLEQTVVTADDGEEGFSNAHVGSCSFHGFVELRRWLGKGTMLLDLPCTHIDDIVDRMLRSLIRNKMLSPHLQASVRNVILCHHHHTSARNAETRSRSNKLSSTAPMNSGNSNNNEEAFDVLVGSVAFLQSPIICFVRLENASDLGEMTEEEHRGHVKYLFLLLGPPHQSGTLYREMGRAFAVMMSQSWFADAIRHATSKVAVLKCVDHFLDRTLVIPKLSKSDVEEYAQEYEQTTRALRRRRSFLSCLLCPSFGSHEDEGLGIRMADEPKSKLAKAASTIRLSFQDNDVVPASSTFSDRLMLILISILSIAIVTLCLVQVPSSDISWGRTHMSRMFQSGTLVLGGFKSVISNNSHVFEIPPTASVALANVKIIGGTVNLQPPPSLFFQLHQNKQPVGSAVSLTLDKKEEVELTELIDVSKLVQKPFGSLEWHVWSDSTAPVAFMFSVNMLGPVAYFNFWFTVLLLISVYILMAFNVLHRTVCMLIGAIVSVLYLHFTHGGKLASLMIGTLPQSSTILLLFSLMVVAQVISTTGMIEYVVIHWIVPLSGNQLWRFGTLLCLLSAFASLLIDNVTSMLLIAPVTLEVCKGLKLNPIPLLIGEAIFSNIGGTATLIGDPPNIIIGSQLSEDVQFVDFLKVNLPCILLMAPFVLGAFYLMAGEEFTSTTFNDADLAVLKTKYAIKNKPLLTRCIVVLAGFVLTLLLEPVHNVDIGSVAFVFATLLLLATHSRNIHSVFELLEWETLLFFVFNFVMVNSFNELGFSTTVAKQLGEWFVTFPPGTYRLISSSLIILWISAVISCLVDNIPFTALMIQIILLLGKNKDLGLSVAPLAISLSLGAGLGSSGTLLGSGVNLVVINAAQHKGVEISFSKFSYLGLPISLLACTFASLYILVYYYVQAN